MIDETKSVRAAGQRMQLSYSSCCNIIRTLESQLNYTLIERGQGGAGGSASDLTQRGRKLLERYNAYDKKLKEQASELYAARATDLTIPLPGAENHEEGLARFTAAMEKAANLAPGDFAVVAHGGVIAQFLQSVSGSWYKPAYAEIVILTYQNGIFTLLEG